MTHWMLIFFLIVWPASSIAFDIPYGVQDPFKSPGFPVCAGGEKGYWQFIVRAHPTKGEKPIVSMVLTTVDVADPAFVICWVDGRHRVMAMGEEKDL